MKHLLKAVLVAAIGMMVGLTVNAAEPAAGTVRLHGATSAAKQFQAKSADIEAKAGTKVEIVGNSSGRGLQSLVGGSCDIAMVAGTMKLNAEYLNSEKPGSVDASKLSETVIFHSPIVFVVNKSNAVDTLTTEQAKGLLSGKITNWKDVGGADEPVVLIIPPPTDGVRLTLRSALLDGGSFASTARQVASAPDANKVIPQVAGAISFMSATNKGADVKALKSETPLQQVYSLVTIGEPSGKLADVVKTIQEMFGDKK